jgi:hypothetical protein
MKAGAIRGNPVKSGCWQTMLVLVLIKPDMRANLRDLAGGTDPAAIP